MDAVDPVATVANTGDVMVAEKARRAVLQESSDLTSVADSVVAVVLLLLLRWRHWVHVLSIMISF